MKGIASLRGVVEELKAAIAGNLEISIHLPQVPYLVQGSALPPNREFLAVLKTEKPGEIPAVEQAVALVMADYEKSNLAGQEAICALLKDILAAVAGIELGDSVLGQAVERYNRKMAVVRGGL